MDLAQLAQMVNWLDEEHRRDRAEIARLQQLVETQSAEMVEQTRRIQELEGRLASTQAQLTRFTQLEQQIQNLKNEVTGLVERESEARANALRETERNRLSDREALTRQIAEVRRELPRLNRLEEDLESRREEDARLAELVAQVRNQIGLLSKELEERTRQLPFLAEQRTSDTKRIAQLQQETVELFKRSEALQGRLNILEETLRRTSTEVEKWRPIFSEIREEQQAFMDRLRLEVNDRLQVLARWEEVIEEQQNIVRRAQEQIQSFGQQVEQARRAAQTVQDFQAAIRRDHAQVQELQRLAEERLRREMEEFREEYEKLRRKAELQQQHLWQEQHKHNQEIQERFPAIYHDLRVHEELLRQLWALQESYGTRYLAAAQAWLDGLQEALADRDERLKALEEEWERQRRNAELYASQGNRRRTSGILTGNGPEPS